MTTWLERAGRISGRVVSNAMFSLNMPINIDLFEIADNLDYENSLELIKLIDLQQLNTDFTEEAALYLLNEAIKGIDEGSEVKAFKRSVNYLLNKYK